MGGSFEVAFHDEPGFVDCFQSIRFFANGDGKRVDADGAAVKAKDDCFEDALVHFVESVLVDVEHGESLVGDGFGDASVVADLGVVADAAEEVVGDAGSASAAAGDFPCAVFFDGDVEKTGGTDDDVAELLGGVVVKSFFDGESADEGAGEEAAARGGADEGKFFEVDSDASGVGALIDDDVQFEVFHSGVEVFFDVFLHAVDFVDEQHVSLFEVGEQAGEVARFFDSGAAGAFEAGFHGFGDDVGQRGFS